MAKGLSSRIGSLTRSGHTKKPRAAVAKKLAALRGKEKGAKPKLSAFEDALVLAAKPKVPKPDKDKKR